VPKKRSFASELSAAQRRLQTLQGEAGGLADPERLTAELAVLREQLEVLEVAHEELEQQNQALLEAREELERQRHRYGHLFEEAPFGYLVTDLQGNIEEINGAAAALFGGPQILYPRKPLTVFFDGETQGTFLDLIARVRAGERIGEVEVRIRSRDREPFAAMLAGVRDPDTHERAARLRWTLRDVSQTRAAQEALRSSEERLRHSQRLEAVGRLAGGIAHSFNNLLAAISFQCELLCDALEEGDPRRGPVEEIQRAGERAAALARQLLAYGRKQVLQPRVLRLNDVIREVEPMLRRLIGEHIRLETRLDPADGAIHVDLGQLEQVILNLAVNARDAMREGGTLELAVESAEIAAGEAGELPPGSYVRLSVRDTGSGMAPEVMQHIFEPFFTTKERGAGTGLGLATVHGIVHQSGGQIRAESEPGRGTRFLILLPRIAEEAERAPVRPTQRARRVRHGSEVVLLVEDEDNIRQPAVEILESRGYRVLAAADGTAALAASEGHDGPIHILVTDVVMPGISGNQLAQRLLARRPEMRVLYISGYPEDAIAHHGVLHPEQHFLQKPFPPGQFLEKVREVLDARTPMVHIPQDSPTL
jgi:PAS domain S-box-containing protein